MLNGLVGVNNAIVLLQRAIYYKCSSLAMKTRISLLLREVLRNAHFCKTSSTVFSLKLSSVSGA
jgi:hypothetical protein